MASGLLPGQVSPSLAAVDDRMPHLGHATFDFMDWEYGYAGIRRFLLAMRAAVVGDAPADGASPYETAFGITPEEFDRGFYQFMLEEFRR